MDSFKHVIPSKTYFVVDNICTLKYILVSGLIPLAGVQTPSFYQECLLYNNAYLRINIMYCSMYLQAFQILLQKNLHLSYYSTLRRQTLGIFCLCREWWYYLWCQWRNYSNETALFLLVSGPSCSWSHGSWIYTYLCNQCL